MPTLLQMISHPDDFSRGSNCSLTFDSMIPFCFKAHYSVFCSILILQNIFIKIVILLIYRPNRKAGNDSKSQSHAVGSERIENREVLPFHDSKTALIVLTVHGSFPVKSTQLRNFCPATAALKIEQCIQGCNNPAAAFLYYPV